MLLFFFTQSLTLSAQTTDHWETVVYNTDTWKYFIGNSEPPALWRSPQFNDDTWAAGPGGFGYADGDDNTVIPQCYSVFLRIKFNVNDTSVISRALLNIDYDDAFVAYLNGIEIARAGLTGIYPAFNEPGIDHEAKIYQGIAPESFPVDLFKQCLVPGENVLSVQIHNSSLTSSDLSSNVFLSFGIKTSSSYFRPVPGWFTAPIEFSSSNLPIVIINTDGNASIPDEPRVKADMKIIYRGENLRNCLTDQNNPEYLNYNGRIDIEIRGSSSQVAPKKQYGFSTKNADGFTNNNVKLLGLPEDNDWILNGLVFEPSLIRNYLCYNLSRKIGEYASRTVYCELVINGQYQGLYLLLEKIKQGHDRVNVIEMDRSDNNYPDVTGGYITKADKTTGGDPVAWTMSSPLGTDDVTFIHELPESDDVTTAQTNYIKAEFEKLKNSAAEGNTSLINGYPSVIDVRSFIDYMIINELGANADAYQFSTYFHKDRNGKLRAGPIWDLDLTFGYDLFFWGADRSKTDKWQFDNGDNEGAAFWRDLFLNSTFRCYLSKRWNQLIQPGQALNPSSIDQFIDQTELEISEAVARENDRWSSSLYHADEIDKIKTFIRERVAWITNAVGPCYDCNTAMPPLVISKIMYYPDSTFNYPHSKDQEFIEILNNGSETVNLTGVYFSGTGLVYQFPPSSFVGPHGTVILASNSEVVRSRYGIPVQGEFTRNLSNNGEALVLADGFGNVIDSVKYSCLPPWPPASANGNYLELADPLSDNSQSVNWISSNNQLVSVNSTPEDISVSLYPTPVRDNLTVKVAGSRYVLNLYDFNGTLLKTVKVDSESYELDMRSCKPGIYLIRLVTPGKTISRKIIKE